MSDKLPQIHLDVLKAYNTIEGQEIRGKNLTQIAEDLQLSYTTTYVMNVTSKLIRRGLLTRNIEDDVITYFLSEEAKELIGEDQESNPIRSIEQVAADIKKEEVQFTEKDKEKAILSMLNETLLKTVVYCKDLSDQLSSIEQEEKIKKQDAEIAGLKEALRRSKMLVDHYEKDRDKSMDDIPNIVAQLKCYMDSKFDDFFELIPWQRELVRDRLKEEIMVAVDEAQQDILKTIKKSED